LLYIEAVNTETIADAKEAQLAVEKATQARRYINGFSTIVIHTGNLQ